MSGENRSRQLRERFKNHLYRNSMTLKYYKTQYNKSSFKHILNGLLEILYSIKVFSLIRPRAAYSNISTILYLYNLQFHHDECFSFLPVCLLKQFEAGGTFACFIVTIGQPAKAFLQLVSAN